MPHHEAYALAIECWTGEALTERNQRVRADAKAATEAERAVDKSVEELRTEHQRKSGRRTHP